MLSLKEFRIPDYKEANWEKLNPKKKLEEWFIIKDKNFCWDTIISQDNYISLANSLPGEELYKWRDELVNGIYNEKVSFKEMFNILKKQLYPEKLNELIESKFTNASQYGPYFTNDFSIYIQNINEHKITTSKNLIKWVKKIYKPAKDLLKEHFLPKEFESVYEQERLIYPYYIALKRQGFKITT